MTSPDYDEDSAAFVVTDRQIAANEALTVAIEECMAAYGLETGVLGDYVVLSSIQALSEHGVLITKYPMFLRNGDLPWYRIQGMIATHQFLITKSMAESNLGNG